jgi:hypothetical protein
MRVAEKLNLSPAEALRHMAVTQGTTVVAGQIIAEMKSLWGLLRTTVEAPISGLVEFISAATGHIGIRAASSTIQVRAYINGSVVHVDEGRGVVVESEASFIQGIFGVGGERTGILRVLSIPPGTRVESEHIPADCAGQILVGGHSPAIEALHKAAQLGAVGFVTGSIDDRTLQTYVGYDIGIALTGDEPVSMTLIITEGFGSIAMNPRIIEVLSACIGSPASINGATQVRAGALRPEIITRALDVHEGYDDASRESRGLSVGSAVRLIRVPFFGKRGTVVELPRELAQIETGAFARVARVKLEESQQEVLVPRANMEIASL